MQRQSNRDVWKWIAVGLAAFVTGAGGTSLYGSAALAAHAVEEKAALEAHAELDGIRNAELKEAVRLQAERDIEHMKALARIEGILTTEYAIHHPGEDHTFTEALRIPQ